MDIFSLQSIDDEHLVSLSSFYICLLYFQSLATSVHAQAACALVASDTHTHTHQFLKNAYVEYNDTYPVLSPFKVRGTMVRGVEYSFYYFIKNNSLL